MLIQTMSTFCQCQVDKLNSWILVTTAFLLSGHMRARSEEGEMLPMLTQLLQDSVIQARRIKVAVAWCRLQQGELH